MRKKANEAKPAFLASLFLLAFFGLLMGGFHLLGILDLPRQTAEFVGGAFVATAAVVAYAGFRYDLTNK